MKKVSKHLVVLFLFSICIYGNGYSQEFEKEVITPKPITQPRINYDSKEFLRSALYVFNEVIWRNRVCNTQSTLSMEIYNFNGDSTLNCTYTEALNSTLFCETNDIKLKLAGLLNLKDLSSLSAFEISQMTYVNAKNLVDSQASFTPLLEDSSRHFCVKYSRNERVSEDQYFFDSSNRLKRLTSRTDFMYPTHRGSQFSMYGRMLGESEFAYAGNSLILEKHIQVEKNDYTTDSLVTKLSYKYNLSKLMEVNQEVVLPNGEIRVNTTHYAYDTMDRLSEVSNLRLFSGTVSCAYTYEDDKVIARINTENEKSGLDGIMVIYRHPGKG